MHPLRTKVWHSFAVPLPDSCSCAIHPVKRSGVCAIIREIVCATCKKCRFFNEEAATWRFPLGSPVVFAGDGWTRNNVVAQTAIICYIGVVKRFPKTIHKTNEKSARTASPHHAFTKTS
jgi:hypothetical protein